MDSDSTSGATQCTALVLKGGGVKGLAFAGALQVLESHYSFDAFVGTSAGAITAVLLAAGYRAQELEKALREKDFGRFVSEAWPRCLWRLFTQKGWFSGDPIQEWIQLLLSSKLSRENVTMGDLSLRAIIYAAKRPRGTLLFDTRGQNKDMSADFAARCSMSIPFLFRPHTHEGSRVFDGGVLHNFPFEEYKRKNPGSPVLGLYLSTGPRSRVDRPGIFSELIDLFLDRDERATVDEHREHIVVIDPSPIRTAQFALTETAKEFLLAQGRASALRFLNNHGAEAVSSEQVQCAEQQAATLHGKVVAEDRARRRRRLLRACGWFLAIILFVICDVVLGRAVDRWEMESAEEILRVVTLPAHSFSFTSSLSSSPSPSPQPLPSKLSEEELRSLVGSLFLVSFEDWRVAEQLVEKDGVSGFFLLKANVRRSGADGQRQEDLARNIDRMQELSQKRPWPKAIPGPMPLIIAVDQEGGSTQILPSTIVTEIPAPMALGGLKRVDEVDLAARIVSSELKAIGVNVNLAPVADVNTQEDNSLIRDRSFGGDSKLVETLALAWYETSKCEGIVSVAKHFPGHGSTVEGIEGRVVPVSGINKESLPGTLRPFRKLVDSGIPAVMTSHLNPVNVAQGTVVTFDERMIELLRGSDRRFEAEGLAFEGAILSDDLNMPCVTAPEVKDDREEYQEKLFESVKGAFISGHDLLLVGNVFPEGTTARTMTSEFASLPKGITLPEFRRLLERFSAFIFHAPPEQRDRYLRRLGEALDRVYALRSLLVRAEPASNRLPRLRQLREEHRKEAEGLFRKSFAFLPSGSVCPNFRPRSDTPALVVVPRKESRYVDLPGLATETRKDSLDGEQEGHDLAWYLRERLPGSQEEMVAGQPPSDDEVLRYVVSLGGKSLDLSDTEKRRYKNNLSKKEDSEQAARIAAIVREKRPPLTIFVLTYKRQVDLFGYFLVEASKIPGFDLTTIAVIVTPHPNQLARLKLNEDVREIAGQVTYFFAYTGSRQQAARLFVEELFKLEPGQCPKDWPRPPVAGLPGLEGMTYEVAPRSGKLTCGK
jgi:beta-glucosidase-like glycosyl hydrolase/predicted acylesterase/phospholipase RssA